METVDITKMSVEQLEALGFKVYTELEKSKQLIRQCEENLKAIYERIASVSRTAPVPESVPVAEEAAEVV